MRMMTEVTAAIEGRFPHDDGLDAALHSYRDAMETARNCSKPQLLLTLLHYEARHRRRATVLQRLYTRYNRLRFEAELAAVMERAL